MRLSKLFTKTLILMVILFGTVAAAVSVLSAWILDSHLKEEYRSKAVAIARSIASSSPEAFVPLNAPKVQSIIDQFVQIRGVSFVMVSAPYGEIIAHTCVPQVPANIEAAHKRARMAFKSDLGTGLNVVVEKVGHILDVSVPIIAGMAGFVHVGMDLNIIEAAIYKAIGQVLLITLSIFLLSVVLAYFMMNNVSRPLSQLTDYARKVAVQDFTGALNIHSKDEIGILANTMKSMVGRTQDHVGELQEAVDNATSELQITLEQLQEREEWYRTTFEHTGTAMIVIDGDSTVMMVNSQFEQLCGYPREEIEGKRSWLQFVDSPDLEYVVKYRNLRRRGVGAPNQYEFTFITRRGERRNMVISVELIPGTNKTIASLIDITERITTEQALRESEERYRLLLEASPEAIIVFDAKGGINYVNRAFEEIYGWTRIEIIEDRYRFFSPEEESEVRITIENASQNGDQGAFETRRRTKDGQVLDVDLNFAVLRDHNGLVTGAIGIHHDVTERKKAEAALQEAYDTLETRVKERTEELVGTNVALQQEISERRLAELELRRSQNNLRTILDAMPFGVLVVDQDKKVRQANHSTLALLGYDDPKEIVGRICHETICPTELGHCPVLDQEQSIDRSEEFLITRDGERVPILKSVVPVWQEGEKLLVEAFVDLTDTHKAQDERRILQAQLQHAQKMEAVGTLASGIAHDFNNILQAITGYIQLIEIRGGLEANSQRYLFEIGHAIDRASDLVKGLLTFSRRLEPELRPVELNKEVLSTIRLLERTIPKMIAIETQLADDLDTIHADPFQLESVVVNLATNARDAMPEGGRLVIETKNVWLGEAYCQPLDITPGKYVQLSVSDQGQGMSPETVERVFEPFFTTKEVGQGTGLGLSTVYGIIKAHGGHISCYSEPDLGTTFKIYIPAVESPEVTKAVPVERPKPLMPGGEETVLLVDDEKAVLETAQEILMEKGYQTLTADSGESALEIFEDRHQDIDLVILDLGMPGMGGVNCLKELLRHDPETKVIIASGYSINGQAQEAIEKGAKAFISKPYLLADLLKAVRDVIDTRYA